MVDEQEETHRSGGGGGWCRNSKKSKLPKAPPQRGLGVAQLEKILRDQNTEEIRVESEDSYHFPAVSPPPTPATMPPLMTPMNNLSHMNSSAKNSPFIENFDQFSPLIPPIPTFTGINSSTHSGSSGGCGGGLGVTLPEYNNYPIMWNSPNCDFIGEFPKLDSGFLFPTYFLDKLDPKWLFSSLLQCKHVQKPSPLINVSKSSVLSPSSSSSSGLNHHNIEPPSNQRSDNYNSMLLEEEKMVGIKRRWPFSVEDQPSSYYPHKVPLQVPSSYENFSGFDLKHKKAIFRDMKKSGQSKQNPNNKKGTTDCGSLDASFLSLGPPAASLYSTHTLQEEISEFNLFPHQGSQEYQCRWSRDGESRNKEPFYGFLPTHGRGGIVKTRLKTRGDSVDLNLKLSVGSPSGGQMLNFSKEKAI